MATEIPTFDEVVDLVRVRLAAAKALDASAIHSFRELMADHREVIADGWYWDAFADLERNVTSIPLRRTARTAAMLERDSRLRDADTSGKTNPSPTRTSSRSRSPNARAFGQGRARSITVGEPDAALTADRHAAA